MSKHETRRCTTSGCSGHAAFEREEASAGIRYRTFECRRCGSEQVEVIRPDVSREMAVAASASPATVLVETGRKDRTGDPVLIEIPAPPS